MRKFIKIICVLFVFFIISSCTSTLPQEEEYNIKYFVEGILVYTDSYKTGETPELYVYNINPDDNAIFDGWYDNATFSGNIVTGIGENSSSNINLYGRILEDVKNNLDDLLKITNYSYSITEHLSNDAFEYQVTDTAQFFYCEDFDTYGYYLEYLPDTQRILYNDKGNWYHSYDSENIYLSFIDFFNMIDLGNINSNDFEFNKTSNSYFCKEEKRNSAASLFLQKFVTVKECSDFVIELDSTGTQLKEIRLYLVENSVDNVYKITFSNINNTNIVVPDSIYDEGIYGGPTPTIGINLLHDLYDGADCSATGVVTGIYGNNFYLTDNSGSILVYCGNNTTYLPIVEEGKVLTVKGSISIYKDIAQIVDLIEISVVDKSMSVTAKDLTSISQSTLANLPAEYVNVKNASLVNIPTYSTTNDMTFKIKFNNETVDVFISRHLDYINKNQLVDALENIGVNGKINLNNLHVSKYNEYQLVCTSVTNFKKNTEALVLTDINVTPNKVSIEEGATIDDVLSQFVISKVFNDNSSEELNLNEVSYQTNFVFNKVGTYTITFTYNSLAKEATIEVFEKGLGYIKTDIKEAPNKVAAKNFDLTTALPSIGNPKVLVIPVTFIDYPGSASLVNDLQKAFFGTSIDTGWESLQSYYYKSSYGKLNISGTVLQPYKTNNYASYYDNMEDADYRMIEGALAYYNDQINYADYDTDKDGYIDSIYLVYTRPYDEDGDSYWWAYTYEYYSDDYKTYDGVEADFYTFMSVDFIYDELQGEKVKLNAETIIHETGHLLGLDDYYDYTEGVGPDGGIGGGDMMDYNVGDHNAFSKLMLGWVNPYVLTGSNVTITLNSFEKTGDCIIVPKNWNGSFYSEYFIIDFYTPTGLNEFVKGESGLFSTYGVRIYHINAELANYDDAIVIYDMTKYNNSDTNYRLISLVEADGNNDIDNNSWSEDSDLFITGKTFSTAKWHNNTSAKFTMKVNSINTTVNNENAKITFTFN